MRAASEKTTRMGRTMYLCLGLAAVAAMAVLLSLAAFADPAEARKHKKSSAQIVFDSDRTSGEGVNNPTGDSEIFVMKPDGTNVRQITFNTVDDYSPIVSPDLTKIAFVSERVQQSNPEGDPEIYLMNADGSGQRNLTNTAVDINEFEFDFVKAKR
jgi:WD40-like Beta Propeller Repeat